MTRQTDGTAAFPAANHLDAGSDLGVESPRPGHLQFDLRTWTTLTAHGWRTRHATRQLLTDEAAAFTRSVDTVRRLAA